MTYAANRPEKNHVAARAVAPGPAPTRHEPGPAPTRHEPGPAPTRHEPAPGPAAADDYRFLAIDFETANESRDSACSVALVGTWGRRRVFARYHLIRPPTNWMRNQRIHGISWRDVADAPSFAELWPSIAPMFEGAHFVAAHNAPFDRGVLEACCRAAGLSMPALPFLCTVRLARAAWNLRPARLPDVCAHLGVTLQHHHALSDAEACAQIVVHAGPAHVRAALAPTAARRRLARGRGRRLSARRG